MSKYFYFLFITAIATISAHGSIDERHRNEDVCSAILGDHSIIRYFRSGTEYVQRPNGMYISTDNGLKYLPGRRTETASSPLIQVTATRNFGSHLEIIRRQLGEARYNEVMRSRNPDEALSLALQENIAKAEDQNDILDAETLKAAIADEYKDNEPLTKSREDQVFQVLRGLGRLGEPLLDWLRPLLLAGKLKQLPKSSMQDPIEKSVKPGTFVYKAVRITVLLNGEKTFFLSAGETGLPDSVHRMLLEAMRLIVLDRRILGVQSGYFVITQFIPNEPLYGEIKFVTKGSEKQTVASEIFDFRSK